MKLKRLALALAFGAVLGGAVALADPPRGGYPPDPPSHATKKQWIFDISIRQGKGSITRVSSIFVDNPSPTARMMGRFAVELWVGKELLDRIRFDVPLLDRDPKDRRRGPLQGPRFDNVTTRLKVRMADSPRARYVALVDRATGDVQRFAWPPEPDGRLLPLSPPVALTASAPAARDGGAPPADAGAADASPSDAGLSDR